MKNKTLALLISLLPLVSACSEGRNLFPADAVELLGEIVAKTQSPDFLLPATFSLKAEGPRSQREIQYDGGTHRLYIKEEREGAMSERFLYVLDGVLYEYRLVDGGYVTIPYPYGIPEASFRDLTAPYVIPYLELNRMVPEGAMQAISKLQKNGSDLSWQVLSSGPSSADIAYAGTRNDKPFAFKASIEKTYLKSLSMSLDEETWSYRFSYALPSFPEFPVEVTDDFQEITKEEATPLLEALDLKEGMGRYESGTLLNRRLKESALLMEEEESLSLVGHKMSLDPKPFILTFLGFKNGEEPFYQMDNEDENGLYTDLGDPAEGNLLEAKALYSSYQEGAIENAKALLSNDESEIKQSGDILIIRSHLDHAIIHEKTLLHYYAQKEGEISYYDYSYPPILEVA